MAGLLVGAAGMFATMYSTQAILPRLGEDFGVSLRGTALAYNGVIPGGMLVPIPRGFKFKGSVPGGGAAFGTPSERHTVPWCRAGRKPLAQAAGRPVSPAIRTT